VRTDASVIELRNPSRDGTTGRPGSVYGVPANSCIPEADDLIATAVRVIGENGADADAVAGVTFRTGQVKGRSVVVGSESRSTTPGSSRSRHRGLRSSVTGRPSIPLHQARRPERLL